MAQDPKLDVFLARIGAQFSAGGRCCLTRRTGVNVIRARLPRRSRSDGVVATDRAMRRALTLFDLPFERFWAPSGRAADRPVDSSISAGTPGTGRECAGPPQARTPGAKRQGNRMSAQGRPSANPWREAQGNPMSARAGSEREALSRSDAIPRWAPRRRFRNRALEHAMNRRKALAGDAGPGCFRWCGGWTVRQPPVEEPAGASNFTASVPYVPTRPEVVDAMLALGGVGRDDTVYDLGCGDGRIVDRAAKRFGARGWRGHPAGPHLAGRIAGLLGRRPGPRPVCRAATCSNSTCGPRPW